MPQLEVETTASRQVWQSPDGERTIYELTLEYNGQPVKANTFSEAIATVGWKGTVERYEKPGKAGKPAQTFVKQPPKEGGGYPSGPNPGYKGDKPAYVPKDDKAIQAMWAIGRAVELFPHAGLKPGDDPIEYVEFAAQELYAMVARVKASEDAPEAPDGPAVPDVVHPVRGDETDAELLANMDKTLEMPADFLVKPEPVTTPDPTEVDVKSLGSILGDITPVSKEETPWPNPAT